MACRVLVTRPEPGAARSAKKLAMLGFEPVLLPLTETRALPVTVDELVGQGAAVAVTSANAIRHAPKELLVALADLPCHAVGGKTAQAAREAGFAAVHEGLGDAEGLAAEMAAGYPGKTVAYLCGRVRLPGFERRLAAVGIEVLPLETYDTPALNHDSEAVAERLGDLPVDIVLLYSARAAEALAALGHRPALAHLLGNATLLCLSERVAAALYPAGRDRIRVSQQPNEEALFSLLPT